MGGKYYSIVCVINNNVVSAMNERHQERILVGKGIGFKARKGDLVDAAKIDKEYFLKSKSVAGKLYALLAQTPESYMEIADKIVKKAQEELNKELDESVFLNLIDHMSFAVSRMEKGLEFKNTLLWEIVHFYPVEYKIAEYGLELLKEYTGCELPPDEAGSIAMHIVNAEFDQADRNDAVRMTEMIHKIVSVVRYQFHTNFDENSLPEDIDELTNEITNTQNRIEELKRKQNYLFRCHQLLQNPDQLEEELQKMEQIIVSLRDVQAMIDEKVKSLVSNIDYELSQK